MAVLLLLLLAVVVESKMPYEKVPVTVMYESLCPDSIRFIKDQLKPTFEVMGPQRMAVDFIPYGKATTTEHPNSFTFRCQHGPSECRGNMLQACALHRLRRDNNKQVEYVSCVMASDNPSRPSDKCATLAGLNSTDLRGCVEGREGMTLLAAVGKRSERRIQFVPKIIIGEDADQKVQDRALSDLLHLVCDHLEEQDRPADCQRKTKPLWFFWG